VRKQIERTNVTSLYIIQNDNSCKSNVSIVTILFSYVCLTLKRIHHQYY